MPTQTARSPPRTALHASGSATALPGICSIHAGDDRRPITVTAGITQDEALAVPNVRIGFAGDRSEISSANVDAGHRYRHVEDSRRMGKHDLDLLRPRGTLAHTRIWMADGATGVDNGRMCKVGRHAGLVVCLQCAWSHCTTFFLNHGELARLGSSGEQVVA
jgi:hypothetical protein